MSIREFCTDGFFARNARRHGCDCSFRSCPQDTRIWWGAYLGTPDELLVSGTVGDVGEKIALLRADARARLGWIMDTYLLRKAGPAD